MPAPRWRIPRGMGACRRWLSSIRVAASPNRNAAPAGSLARWHRTGSRGRHFPLAPLKILVVSDLHFSLPQFDWLVQQADRFACIIIAGDLLDISGHLDLDSQITVVVKYLRTISAKTRLLVCSGNHDGDEKNDRDEFVARWLQRVRAAGLTVDGAGLTVDGLRLSVCPWWDGPSTRETMQAFLRAEKAHVTRDWLWVHHAPPDGVGVSWTGKVFAGDAHLPGLINELDPDYVVSGHIHNSPFRTGGAWAVQIGRSWVFNSGRQSGAPPALIELDVGTRTARWVSQAGEEQIAVGREPAAAPT